MPDNVTNQETSSETVTISNNTPTRNGYNFQGWCTVQVADGADCTGTSYSAGGNWTIDQTASSNSLSIYAIWGANCPEGELCMQEMTLSDCEVNVDATSGIGDELTVYDKRDGQRYTARRFNNGDCWMTTNLNLAGGTTLEHTLTNVPEGYSTETAGFVNGDTLPVSSTEGFSDDSTAYVYNSGTITCDGENPCYSYYSWPAAKAGYTESTDYDICPSGWKMALNFSGGQGYVAKKYFDGSASSGSATNNQLIDLFLVPFVGYYSDNSFLTDSSYCNKTFWFSTPVDETNSKLALCLSKAGYATKGGADRSRSEGHAVRCIIQR